MIVLRGNSEEREIVTGSAKFDHFMTTNDGYF